MGEKMNRKALLLGLMCWSTSVNEAKQDLMGEVVVSASQAPISIDKSGPGVSIISKKKLEDSGITTLDEALEKLAGLNISKAGSSGQNASLFVRGAESSYVLVMLDGVELHDPSDLNRAAILHGISLNEIERIEIIKRASGTVFGSDAIAGAVNIITKTAKEDSTNLYTGFGSNSTYTTGFALNKVSKKLSFGLFGNLYDTDGISVADELKNSEKDSHKNLNFGMKFDVRANNGNKSSFYYRHFDIQTDFDGFVWGTGPVDANNRNDETRSIFKFSHEVATSDHLTDKFEYSSFKTVRDITDTAFGNSRQSGEALSYKLQRTIYLDDSTVTVGYEHDMEQVIELDRESQINSFYGEYQRDFKNNWNLISGFRTTNHNKFGSHNSISSVVSKEVNRWLFSASFASGFKSPSLNQMFGQWGPNQNLKPVESVSRDISAEYSYKKGKASLSYFNNNYKNMIVWAGVFPNQSYQNVARAEVNGWELKNTYQISDNFDFNASLERLSKAEQNGNARLLRRPKTQNVFSINWASDDKKSNVVLYHRRKSSRIDVGNVTLPSYQLWDLSFTKTIKDDYKVTFRIDNLQDKRYQEQDGYTSAGRTVYVKVSREF
jgi:vitamin B12 transporter